MHKTLIHCSEQNHGIMIVKTEITNDGGFGIAESTQPSDDRDRDIATTVLEFAAKWDEGELNRDFGIAIDKVFIR